MGKDQTEHATPLPGTRLWIELAGGDRPPAELPRRGTLVVGSSPDRAGLVVEGEGIEPVHCTIRRLKGGGWALVDAGSEIGTRVNGRISETVRLNHGDTISIGTARLHVFDPQARAAEEEEAAGGSPGGAKAAGGARRASANGNGTRISGYRIERTLGRGGMGQVYLAVQERLDRQVALKILPPRLAADVQFVRRFEAEARAAAALNHPNVVTVYDVGEEGGKHFLSMEYMHEGCLESRLAREGRLPWPIVLDILHDAASGLVYAESRGIVHRDIKPSNLMQNEDGMTKIADLGLAVQVEEGEALDDGERILGTPHFIAPELIRGAKPDSRSDLYSLGATAYRLVTGRTPFEGDTAREILRSALHDAPRPVHELAPDVPAELGKAIERLLSKDPMDRHPSAAILLQELSRLREGADRRGGSAAAPGGSSLGKLALLGLTVAALAVGGWFVRSYLSLPDDTAAARETEEGPENDETEFEGLAFEEGADALSTDAGDDDMAARLLEAEAEVEYLKLGEEVLPDEEREARLVELAERYKGTRTAFRALAEVTATREARDEAAVRSREDEAEIREALDGARRAAAGIDPLRARSALEALHAAPVPARLAGDATFLSGRSALESEVFTRAIDETRTVLADADDLARKGDFDGLRQALEDYCNDLELPEAAEEGQPALPAEAATLEELATRAYTRLSSLDRERRTWRYEQEAADRGVVAAGFRGTDGLAAHLSGFDFEGAAGVVDAALASVHTPEARDSLGALREDLASAATSLETLGTAWGDGAWRRKSIADPRGTRIANRDAVGADARGVLVDGTSGTDHVPWSAWAGKPRALHILFNERLARPWSPAETEGIAALFRLAAVSAAADAAGVALADEGSWDAERSLDFFEHAAEWAGPGTASEALASERAAVELLAGSLVAAEEGDPAVAVARLERLLTEYPDTLFVRLLSDGDHAPPRPVEPQAVDHSARVPVEDGGSAAGSRGARGGGKAGPPTGGSSDEDPDSPEGGSGNDD